jgi:pilus assembly protein FimV
MLKRLALALAVFAWWLPAQVFALGLGNIEMKSALNQPLDARIELLRAREGELKDLSVALASVDTFRRAGIERPAFLSQLKFEVMSNPGGTPFIQVSSPQPITEPFLNFLIEVNWPNGRLLREFTVLVDPPVLTDTPPVAVTAPAAQAGVDAVGIVVDEVAADRMRAEAEARGAAAAAAAEPVVAEAPSVPAGGIEIPTPGMARAEAERESAPVTLPSAPEPAVEDAAADAVAAVDAPPAEVTEAPVETVRPEPTRREQPVRRPEPEPVAEAAAEPSDVRDTGRGESEAAAGDFSHKVQANDTLWEIAMNSRPKNVSVPQMMIALLENNPEAFVDNNINNLKRGAVLRLSDVGVALNISKDEAMRIADLQWEQWKQQRGSLIGSTMARRGAPAADVAPSEARVKLVSPDSDTTGSEAPGAAASAGTSAAARLRRELAVAQEALDSQRRETQDMRDRVASLEEQLSTMKRLIQMKDDQLAAMQTQSKTSSLAPEAETPAAAAAPAATAEEKPAETKAAAKPAAKPKVEEPPAKSTGLLAGLMSDPKLIGLAGVVVGLIVLLTWLFVRRRKMQQFQESILTLDEAASSSISSDMKTESEDASFMSDFTVSSMEGIQTDINEVDPLSEADVYLAYGRHKQAEELVTQAIQKDPQRAELKMKLLEIHYAAKDKDAFAMQAEIVRDEFSTQQPEMWARVLEMGRELAPENALFGGSATAAAAGGGVEEFDLGDLNIGDATAPSSADELSLDFDLAGEDTAATAAGTEQQDDNSLDFDLGDFKVGSETEAEAGAPAAADEHSLDFDLSAFDQKQGTAQEAADDANSMDFDLGSLGDTIQSAADEVSLETASAGLDAGGHAGLDFKLDDEPISAAPAKPKRDDNVVDFSLAASSAKSDVDTAVEDREIDGELDDALFADVDEVGTKLDLAKAYIDMGDSEGARSILDEVMEEGDDSQKQEAQVLMRQIG